MSSVINYALLGDRGYAEVVFITIYVSVSYLLVYTLVDHFFKLNSYRNESNSKDLWGGESRNYSKKIFVLLVKLKENLGFFTKVPHITVTGVG